MSIIKTVKDSVLAAFFPNRCAGCGEIINREECFCDYCFELLHKTANDNLCKTCGCKKSQCQCKYTVFHFNGCAAPFYNENPAKKAMYGFKFRKKIYFADVLAREMAICVKTRFYGVHFDAVTYVPMPLKKEMRRGYNPSRELAKRISEILDVSLAENVLGCRPEKKTQHKTGYKERFKNVKGMYFANTSLTGRTVLLVDDIKTTGATFDECTKQLLSAGADKVYCIAGLITERKNKTKAG